jgi:nitroreductase
VRYWDVDTGMASMLILLTAVDEGLGALFFGMKAARLDAFRAAFGVPTAFSPVGVVAVGHRAPDAPSPSLRRGRRGLDEVVHRGRW